MSYGRYHQSKKEDQNDKTVLNFEQSDDDSEATVRAALLRESGHLTRSEQLIDEQYNIALHAREELINQRASIRSMQNQYNGLAESFQAVNTVIKRIALRKRKETIILAIVFAIALGFLLYSIF